MTEIQDQDEVQFRQVHPNWMEEGEPSRLAFIPTRKDEGKLSLDRSATTSAKASFTDFREQGLKSDAVFGLTPAEFADAPNSVKCYSSPLDNNPHHSHAEFTELSNSQKKSKSQSLRLQALARGKLHP